MANVNLSSLFDVTSANLAFPPSSVILSELALERQELAGRPPALRPTLRLPPATGRNSREKAGAGGVELATFAHSPSTHSPLEVQLGSSHKEPTHAQRSLFPFPTLTARLSRAHPQRERVLARSTSPRAAGRTAVAAHQ